jgi:hypothetical protein
VSAYFFLWNPQKDTLSFRNFDKVVAQSLAGKPCQRRWICPSKQLRKGDEAFLQRTGRTNNGVFARGTVLSEPFEGNDGVRVVELEFESFLPIGLEISRDDVVEEARFQGHWAPYASGNIIPREASNRQAHALSKKPSVSKGHEDHYETEVSARVFGQRE